MITTRSVTVARTADIKPGELVAFEVEGVRIAVANAAGRFFAIADTRTHEQCSLAAEGTLDGTVVTCGCHGAQFDVMTGAVLAPPAPEPIKAYCRGDGVDSVERKVGLTAGGSVHYDKLLIASGVRNRRPPIPGLDLQNVFDLRSISDADALRVQIVPGRKAAVIGMGFIGCEVAASLRQKGIDVVCIDPAPTPLFRVVGAQVGQVMSRMHRDHGVEMVFEDAVTRFEGDRRVERVITKRNRRIDCDIAVVGIGVEPVTEFIAESGVKTSNGILVDEYCATNVPDIYAAGDVANHYHPLFQKRMRVEHWLNALQQGAAAARSMLGQGQPYRPVHWFWSDQYDVNVQYAGFHQEWDQVVVRGNLGARDVIAFYLSGGRIDAVVAVNRGKDVRRVMPLIKSRATVDPRQLGDQDVDLRTLVDVAVSGAQT